MKILHLYSDWKWTGPAEPAIQMARAMQDRGHEVLFACRAPDRKDIRYVHQKAAEVYHLKVTTDFRLDRHFGLRNTAYDLRRLPRFVKQEQFDVVHTHLSHDHSFCGSVLRLRLGRNGPALVRTIHRREVLARTLANRFLLGRLTDGVLLFTEGFRRQTIERFGLDPEKVGVQPMTLDLERYRPDRTFKDMRAELGAGPDAVLIGIVGRYQKYRRMDVFLQAAKMVLEQAPHVRFVIIGRSGQIQETVLKPVEALGIGAGVIHAGYRVDDYDDTLACLDVFTLLMPGFDGTARAAREAMALGKPCVTSDFGMLPDIVPNGVCGYNAPLEDVDALAAAWLKLVRDPALRRSLGQNAAEHARQHFRLDAVGPALEAFYGKTLARRQR
jgi:glycosyltransferase involved in cell wall biosynthesis